MLKYIGKRVLILLITLFIIVTITFFMMQIMPGTPFNNPKLSPDAIANLNKTYGLDKPLWQQYLQYLTNVAHLDFGQSFTYKGQAVTDIIGQRLPVSAQLGFQALVVGTGLGIFTGMWAARKKNTWIDTAIGIFDSFGLAMPSFIFAMLLVYYFGYKWPIFPVTGWGDSFSQTILPTIALAIGVNSVTSRFLRTEMVEALSSDYVQLARAKGLSDSQVANRHALRNSLIPILTLIGPAAAGLMTGSLLIESIFSIPGIGQQFVNSVPSKDFPVIMGTTIVYSLMLMTMILITDIITAFVDPRVRLS